MTAMDPTPRLRFLQIDDSTRRTLLAFRPVLQAQMEDVLDHFYGYLQQQPQLVTLFSGPDRIAHARQMQARHWLDNVFSGNFGADYMRQVTIIGRTHERIGLEPRWYMGAYCFTLNRLVALVMQTQRRPDQAAATIAAINKAVFLDMDLAVSIYIQAAQEKAAETLSRQAAHFEAEIQGTVAAVAEAARQLLETSGGMTRTADATSMQAASVADAAETAAASVETVASAAEELTVSISEISRQVQDSNSISHTAVQETARASDRIEELVGAVNQIGVVVRLINDIASQTNMLALNATIEAARAGDAGKGFAVVASEVKSLANQTSKATGEISGQIASVQTATNDVVTAIEGIRGTISSLNTIASSIAGAVEQQGAATREIARNTQAASGGTSTVTSSIQLVTEASGETGEAARNVMNASRDLTQRSDDLKGKVDAFLRAIRTA